MAGKLFWSAPAERLLLARIGASSGRSDIFIASQPHKPTFKLRRSGMEGVGEPPATGLQSSYAAPTELDSAGGPLRYKYVTPTGSSDRPARRCM